MEYRADMVASVQQVLVREGQRVSQGDTLVMLESMKMEIPVFADVDSVVDEVLVSAGDVVQEGDILVTCSPVAL